MTHEPTNEVLLKWSSSLQPDASSCGVAARCRCISLSNHQSTLLPHRQQPQGWFIGALQTPKWHQTHTLRGSFREGCMKCSNIRPKFKRLAVKSSKEPTFFSCSLCARQPQTMRSKSSGARIQRWTIQKMPLKRSPTVTKDKEHGRGVPGKHQTPLYLSKLGFHHSRHNLFCKDYEYKWNLLQIIDAVSSE